MTEVTLEKEIPEDIKILVIAEMKEELTETETQYLDKYIARGGNLLITSEPKRLEIMAPLLNKFGIQPYPGTLVEIHENISPDLIMMAPTQEAIDLNFYFANMQENKRCFVTPGVSGLSFNAEKGYTAIPLFATSTEAWNEQETTNFIDEKPVCSGEKNEERKSFVTAYALSRKVDEKEQKVIVLGDADCFSNGEFSRSRNGVPASNYSALMGAFFWMSDEEVPIDVRRPEAPDNEIYLTEAQIGTWKLILTWIFPGVLLIISILIWLRRRGR